MKGVLHITFFYIENRRHYVEKILKETETYPFPVDIFIHTNVNISGFSYSGKLEVVIHDLTNIHPYFLTWKCRELLYKQREDYDVFMYLEDDILVPKQAIEYWLHYSSKLECKYNLGFLRIETSNGLEYITDFERGSSLKKTTMICEKNFVVNDVNPYCAFWIYSKKDFALFLTTPAWMYWTMKGIGIREASAFGMIKMFQTVIPLVDDSLDPCCKIYHMPNNYIGSGRFACILFNDVKIVNMELRYSKTWFLTSEIKKTLLNFVDKTKKHSVLEIGCYEGLSSVFFAENLLNDSESSLVCVDPFMSLSDNDHKEYLTNNEEANFDHNIRNCKNSEKITVHKVTSDSFFETNVKTYDLIYIDGCHEPEFIQRDMENSFRALEENGIMWMDDYGGGDGIQIKSTMDTFLDKYAGQYTILNRGYQLAIKKHTIKLVDSFIFYNELGMLKYRLELLYPIVDQFIICESTLTFSGNQKPLYYQDNKHLYEKYADKIVHVIVDDMPVSTNAWDRERHQRRSISRGFKNLDNSDIISFSDLDEIPNPDILTSIKKSGLTTMISLSQDLYYYNLTTMNKTPWNLAKVLPYSYLSSNPDLQICRNKPCNLFVNGGWHLSYFGDEKFISNKIKNFSHQEYNTEEYTNEEKIKERIKSSGDLYDRTNNFRIIPLDENKNLPPNYTFLLQCLA